jgi:hypothetical protein
MYQENFYKILHKKTNLSSFAFTPKYLLQKNNGSHAARQKPVTRGRRCPSKPALVLLPYLLFHNLRAFIKRSGLSIR